MAEDLLSIPIVTAAFKIRPMAATDAEAVAELAGELGYPNETEPVRSRIRTIRDADLLLVTVDSNNRPVGFIQAHRVCIIELGFRVEILGLVVSSTARRRGIARRFNCRSRTVGKKHRCGNNFGAKQRQKGRGPLFLSRDGLYEGQNASCV
jgi:4-hydroxyphenylpyruvate dioxygenase-like putative hemolysin